MSNAAINWVFGNRRNEPGLRGPKNAQRLVLLVLANYADDDGEAYPGLDTIALEANVTRNTAKAALGQLIEDGYLEREVRAGRPRRGSRQQRNVYRLVWDVERGEGPKSDPSLNATGEPESRAAEGPKSDARGPEIRAAALHTGTQGSLEGTSVAESDAPVLTTNQIANKMQRGFWTWVEQQTGHAPLSIKPVGFQRLMAHFIDAGCTRETISCAVKELHRRGAPITQATIEAQMDGRRSTPRNGRPAVEQQLDALTYDDQGRLVQ